MFRNTTRQLAFFGQGLRSEQSCIPLTKDIMEGKQVEKANQNPGAAQTWCLAIPGWKRQISVVSPAPILSCGVVLYMYCIQNTSQNGGSGKSPIHRFYDSMKHEATFCSEFSFDFTLHCLFIAFHCFQPSEPGSQPTQPTPRSRSRSSFSSWPLQLPDIILSWTPW